MLAAVYGSLRKGLGNHRLIEHCEMVGTFNTEPIYNLFSLGAFPGLTKDGETSVTVEVYKIDDNDLRRLDMLEGYQGEEEREHNFYNREAIDTPFGEAFIYFYNGGTGRLSLVESGDWTEFKTSKASCQC